MKQACKDAVSKSIGKAINAYYQACPGGGDAELIGRIFEEYLRYFRRILWGSENTTEFITAIEKIIGPLPEWVTKDLLEKN